MDEFIDNLPVQRPPEQEPHGAPRLRRAERSQDALQVICIDH